MLIPAPEQQLLAALRKQFTPLFSNALIHTVLRVYLYSFGASTNINICQISRRLSCKADLGEKATMLNERLEYVTSKEHDDQKKHWEMRNTLW